MNAPSQRYWRELPGDVDVMAYARTFVEESVASVQVVAENRLHIADPLEIPYFLPAMHLLVAGLVAGTGPLGKHTHAASFAVSIVDHLLVGWNALLSSRLRVACTVSRHAAEAAIFEAASIASPSAFEKAWDDGKATGGQVLNLTKASLPPALADELAQTWKLAVSFGHVNPGTVFLSKLPGTVVNSPAHHAVTFEGPYTGPLMLGVLMHVAMVYVAITETALRSFAYSFSSRLPESWGHQYQAQLSRIATRSQPERGTNAA